MAIRFIPKNNTFTIDDFNDIISRLRDKIKDTKYVILDKIKKEKQTKVNINGEEYIIYNDDDETYYNTIVLYHPYIETESHFDLKISARLELDDDNITLYSTDVEYKITGLNVITFTAYEKVPRKIMLYLYQILESDKRCLIYDTKNYPNSKDMTIFGTQSIWYDPYLPN
jgi:phosphotransferase system IIB component